jgi:choice-of-anchor B domain-containing protein
MFRPLLRAARRAAALTLLLALASGALAQTALNVSFRGNLPYGPDLSDVWGWTNPADGKEYALVGLTNGFSIVDVSNPTAPTEVQFVSGVSTIWRDVKTWGNYAYVTNEGGGGLLVVDLSGLPGSITTSSWTGGIGFSTAHNIFMDENGIAYLCGSNGSLGTVFIDCAANPANPPVVGSYTARYVHDLYVRGDTMWTAEINNGIFSVVDVSNKAAPVVLASQATSSNFSHNCWLSDDGATLYTTDEVSGANVDAYDVSDLSDIQQLDLFRPGTGPGSIPHNTYVRGNFLLTAWYRDGLRITDATQPGNLIEVGFYDTSPFSGNGFNGAWGAYPYLPSGNVLVSDIEEGLFVLTPSYAGAAFVEGQVTDASSGAPLFNASVTLAGQTATTNLFGQYATGVAASGAYTLTVARSGYVTQNVPVTLTAGSTATANVALVPSTAFTQTGTITASATGTGIAGASIRLESLTGTYTATTNASGGFTIAGLPGDVYDVYVGRWGFLGQVLTGQTLAGAPLNLALDAGYADEFNLDLGWTSSGSASTGQWTTGVPIGTDFSGVAMNPGADAASDAGNRCAMTGNGGGAAGTDDVDGGTAIWTSPLFDLSAYADPSVAYARWWANDGGSGAPNDSLVIELDNGSATAVLEVVTDGDPDESAWASRSFRVADFLSPTATMRLVVRTADRPATGHLVEAGLDAFAVTDGGTPACDPPTNPTAINLTTTSVRVTWDGVPGATGYQVQGRKLGTGAFRALQTLNTFRDINILQPGTTYEWQVRVRCADGTISPFGALQTFTTPSMKPSAEGRDLIVPNPARETARLELTAPQAGPGEWRIVGTDGRTHAFGRTAWTGDAQRVDLPVAGLAPGSYRVVASGNGWRRDLALQRVR